MSSPRIPHRAPLVPLVLALVVPTSLFGAAAPLPAQTTVPDNLREELEEVRFLESSREFTRMFELYEPILEDAPREGVQVTRDVSYGPHSRHLLDLYRPGEGDASSGSLQPVLVFFHGGAYTSGDRDVRSGQAYGNVPTYFARRGLLAVNATYRLAPDHPWPAGAEDVRRVVAWLGKHAADHGGDPDRIFLVGHSAGATHVATYAFDHRTQPPSGPGVAGIVLVSGRYRVHPEVADDPGSERIRAYFGSDPALYPSRSVVNHVHDSEVPAMLVTAEYDTPVLARTSAELLFALCERDDGRCPRHLQLEHHNHMSEVLAINTSDDYLGRQILDFVREGADRQREWARRR